MVNAEMFKNMPTRNVVVIILGSVLTAGIAAAPSIIEKIQPAPVACVEEHLSIDDTRLQVLQKYHSYNEVVIAYLRENLTGEFEIDEAYVRGHISVAFTEKWNNVYSELNRLNLCYKDSAKYLREKFHTEELVNDSYRILSNKSQTLQMRLRSLKIYLKSYQNIAVEKLINKLQETEKCTNS